MLNAASGEPLRLPDGSDRVLLDPLIRIEGDGAPVTNTLDARFGDAVTLACVVVTTEGDEQMLTLRWQVAAPLPADVRTFIHALNADGELVAQADAPPLNGVYPPDLWRDGQTLADAYTLPADPDATQFAIGLYHPEDGSR